MENAGTPEKSPKASIPLTDDIPVAQRDAPEQTQKPGLNRTFLFAGLAVLGVVALAAGSLVSLRMQQTQNTLAIENPSVGASPSSANATPGASPTADVLLGHFAYPEAPVAELAAIVPDGSIKMRKPAAQAFREMVAAAQQEGVNLVPISGYRTLADQKYLYFNVKAERGQVPAERAKVSAPPGYSEHHTGYAVDIGDANAPALNLNPDFDKTAAFRWLKSNAAHYSFELSFPKGNKQGVSYEPWHWRYVGDIHSLKTFYKARESN